ncbi:helix-turn-helix domain-containing protein [Carnobacterium maltaromaticum]|uniref:helix-turn-helix domain-containing protein n=1 Tax=Carnobacterium maltaromaticum TaxID=2751 RepID=UPI0039AFF043
MKKLLDKPFHLILKLLEHFYKKIPQETINYYSDFLNVDRRTILKIITDLERDIADCQWENQLTLEVTETKIIATFSTNFSLENFYRYYMERSLCVELVQSIFKEAEISLDQIIENFFVSRTTFYRRITPLKEVLAEFDLELDFTKKQFLIGEEKQIRYFFSVFFWEIFRSTGEYKHPERSSATSSFSLFKSRARRNRLDSKFN